MEIHVRDLMSEDVVTVLVDMPALLAAKRMVEKRIRHLVVTDSFGRVVGMLSDRDVVKHLSPWLSHFNSQISVHGPAPQGDVQEIMVQRPIVTTPDTTLSTAARLLGGKKIGCLPVVDERNRAVGLLSVVDMLLHMATDNLAAGLDAHSGTMQTAEPAKIE